jgi:hypothetical protein
MSICYIRIVLNYHILDQQSYIVWRIKENLDRINDALRKLECLELIISEQCNSKTDIQLQQYTFTRLGRIKGLLLLYEKGKIKDSKEFLNSLIDFYLSMNNSWSTFYIIFLRKCIIFLKFLKWQYLFI